MTSLFKKASKEAIFLKIAIMGPTGSGKTFSALRIAKGFGGKIAVIDTENGSASLYSDKFDFDVINMAPPFTAQKYIQFIRAAEKEGYDFLIIDSISHGWAGDGGLLNKKDAMDASGKGNSFTNWKTITNEHEQFKSALLQSNIHIIASMRSKMEYSLEKGSNDKLTPKKLGLAPIQRDGIEYEFTTIFDVGMDHTTSVSKDRTELFDGKYFQITEETGAAFKTWLGSEAPKHWVPPPEPEPEVKKPPVTGNALIKPAGSTVPPLTQAAAETTSDDVPDFIPMEKSGEYIIPFGPHKNLKLRDMDPQALRAYCKTVEDKARAEAKEIKGVVKEFLDRSYYMLQVK